MSQAYPALQGLDLYRCIVMERLHTNQDGAEALLRRADENFAWWPTTREITYVDVVHMIAIEEYHAMYGSSPWDRAHMGRIIAAQVDRTL